MDWSSFLSGSKLGVDLCHVITWTKKITTHSNNYTVRILESLQKVEQKPCSIHLCLKKSSMLKTFIPMVHHSISKWRPFELTTAKADFSTAVFRTRKRFTVAFSNVL